MPEHDENGIVAVLCVFGLPGPIRCRHLVKPPDQEISILHVSLQRIVEVAEHQRIVRVITRVVRCNDGSRINQHRFQSIEEQMDAPPQGDRHARARTTFPPEDVFSGVEPEPLEQAGR